MLWRDVNFEAGTLFVTGGEVDTHGREPVALIFQLHADLNLPFVRSDFRIGRIHPRPRGRGPLLGFDRYPAVLLRGVFIFLVLELN